MPDDPAKYSEYSKLTSEIFFALEMFSRKVKELHTYPDFPDREKARIRSAIKILKIYIEDLLASTGEKS